MFKIIAACLAGMTLAAPVWSLDLSVPPPHARTFQAVPPSGPDAVARDYIRGPRGGCYYINGNGNKTYVDRSKCQ